MTYLYMYLLTFDDFVVIVWPQRVVLIDHAPVGVSQGKKGLVTSQLEQ